MARQSKNINYSELFQNIDSELSDTLRKCKPGVEGLRPDDRKKLWECLFSLITQNNVEEPSEQNIHILKNCVELTSSIFNSNNIGPEVKLESLKILKFLNSEELIIEDSGVLNGISRLNEYWMVKVQSPEDIPGMEYFTIKHLLNLCNCDKPLGSDIQRLSAIRKSITAVPFDKSVPSLKPLLVKLVQKVPVLSSEHGQRFIAQALVLSQKLMMGIHKMIMMDLSSCNKKKATYYGRIYVMAWHVASEEMKECLEKGCFQHLMESMVKEQRVSLELSKNSQNILAVLEVWHSERKKKNPGFITMITNSYQPILWKYLQSGFNVHRCNATDVFFKAFPLQRCGDNAVEAETLFNKQFNTMLASLTDDCHIVRIIGIREVCNILSVYWNSFNPVQIQSLLTVITKQNACDASTAEARRMVYLGLQSLIKSPLSRDYVRQILPNLANNIHDINQKVRMAFIQMLICIKDLKDPTFKYSDVVSMFNIQYRLAEDNIAVGQWIVKLLMRNYYHSKMPVVEWTKRFIYLIKTYRNSYRNFFFYSSKSLPFVDACTIILEILTQLGAFVISKSASDQENHTEKPKEKKKGDKKAPLSEWNGSQESSKSESGASKKCAFDDPDVVSGLLDIVTILWVLHDGKLNKPENEEVRFKLYETYIKYAQPLINYYRDSNLFLGVICLSGNIPASLLRNNSITLPGYCIKMLKSIKVDRSEEENEKIISMLIALVKWGRGSEILEQVTLWLDAAFETKDMNETILPRRRVKISESIQPNSVVAIYILDTLLKKEYVRISILKKNYHELFELWKFMSRIQKLIETRLEQGEPFEEDLVSDEFLKLCFRRYVKLIPLLKEEDTSDEEKENQSRNENSGMFVNRQKEVEDVFSWGENLLYPLLQQEELEEADLDLAISLLEDILYVSDNMITVHMVNNMFHFKIGHFVLKLLGSSYGIRFVKASSRIATALNFSAKLLFKVKDDLQIFSTVIPSLLSHILNALTSPSLSSKDVEKIEKDLPEIKTCFNKILAAYQDNLSSTYSLKENARKLKLVVGFFVDSIVNIVSHGIPRKDSSIPLYSAPSQLPPIASSLFSLFHNRKTWTPLFVHVIGSTLEARSYDTKNTVSSILLLHLYATSDKKVNEGDLKKALSSASKCLSRLKDVIIKDKSQIFDSSKAAETETKRTGNAGTNGQNDSRKESKPNEVTGETEESASENMRSFMCCGDNLEMDFINCGYELIKNIENLPEKRSAEADES